MMKPRQWKFQKISSKHAKRLTDSFTVLNTPLLPLPNPSMCLSALYTKDKDSIKKRCSLQIRKASSVSIPMSIAPNVWAITSPPIAVSSGIMLICPGEAPRFIKPQTPIHILQLQPACSATSQHFHLPPCDESHELTVNTEHIKSQHYKQLIPRIQNIAASR